MIVLPRPDLHGRRLAFLALPTLAALRLDTPLPGAHLICLLACDARALPAATIAAALGRLLERGLVYLVTWGPDSERVHDICDELRDQRERAAGRALPLVMTTWHAQESLTEAAWFFLHSAFSADESAAEETILLAVAVGNADWAAEIGRALEAAQVPPNRA